MTFCLGMKVEDGLVGIADTRITSGTERITARKVTIHQHGKHSLFLMTSGLRSVRDKALTYFEDALEKTEHAKHLYEAVNVFSDQVKRVQKEDGDALFKSGIPFNLYSLVGGQLEKDKEHKLFMIYPQGNWVEVSQATPFYIIGESGYGKPILERTIEYQSSLSYALTAGFLAFNATITCAVDVDYPIDVVIYKKNSFQVVETRYQKDDLLEASRWWHQEIKKLAHSLPSEWQNKILSKLQETSGC